MSDIFFVDEQALASLTENIMQHLYERLDTTKPQPDLKELYLELKSSLDGVIAGAVTRSPLWGRFTFIPTGPGMAKHCDIPNNGHRFTPNSGSKHCSNCGADFCDQHPLTRCMVCSHII